MAINQGSASLRRLLLPSLVLVLSVIASSYAASVPAVRQTLDHLSENEVVEEYKESINEWVDEHLAEIRDYLSPLDPASLKDEDFKYVIFRYSLRQGWMQNLALAERGGDCYVITQNGQTKYEFNAYWDELVLDYRYEYRSGIVKKTGDLNAKLSSVYVNMVYNYNNVTKDLTLDDFKFTDVGKLKITTEGSIWDKLGKWFVNILTWVLQKSILKRIEESFRSLLENNKKDSNFQKQLEVIILETLKSTNKFYIKSV